MARLSSTLAFFFVLLLSARAVNAVPTGLDHVDHHHENDAGIASRRSPCILKRAGPLGARAFAACKREEQHEDFGHIINSKRSLNSQQIAVRDSAPATASSPAAAIAGSPSPSNPSTGPMNPPSGALDASGSPLSLGGANPMHAAAALMNGGGPLPGSSGSMDGSSAYPMSWMMGGGGGSMDPSMMASMLSANPSMGMACAAMMNQLLGGSGAMGGITSMNMSVNMANPSGNSDVMNMTCGNSSDMSGSPNGGCGQMNAPSGSMNPMPVGGMGSTCMDSSCGSGGNAMGGMMGLAAPPMGGDSTCGSGSPNGGCGQMNAPSGSMNPMPIGGMGSTCMDSSCGSGSNAMGGMMGLAAPPMGGDSTCGSGGSTCGGSLSGGGGNGNNGNGGDGGPSEAPAAAG